jgi:hypothetical protein
MDPYLPDRNKANSMPLELLRDNTEGHEAYQLGFIIQLFIAGLGHPYEKKRCWGFSQKHPLFSLLKRYFPSRLFFPIVIKSGREDGSVILFEGCPADKFPSSL